MSEPKTPSPSQRAKSLLNNLGEFRADFPDILSQLEELRQQCMDGIAQEKVNVKSPEPMTVIERFPAVAQQCIMGKHTVVQTLLKLAGEEQEQVDFSFQINILALEDLMKGDEL